MNHQSKQLRLSLKLRDVQCRLQELELAMKNFDAIAGYRIAEILARDPGALNDGRMACWDALRRDCNSWRYTSPMPRHGLQDFLENAQGLLVELEGQS